MIFESLDEGEVENHKHEKLIQPMLGNEQIIRRVFLLTRFLNTFCRHNPVTATGCPAGEGGEAKHDNMIQKSSL